MPELSEEQLKQIVTDAVTAAVQALQTTGTVSTAASTTTSKPAFHLVPGGDADSTETWNFSDKDGLAYFKAATQGIAPRYNGEINKLQYFLDQVDDRSDEFGFASVLKIKVDPNSSETRSIVTEYGSITLQQVIDQAKTYLDKETRQRQASRMLISLLKNSLGLDLLDELKTKDYKVKVKINNVDKEVPDGAVMLYQFIQLIAINTKATVSSILKSLTGTGLMSLMEEVKSDIKEFNKKVNLHMVALRARKKEVPDIVPALFEAYKTAGDSTFVAYIERKEEDYEDDQLALDNRKLMSLASEKYKVLLEKKAWGQKTKEELEFIAMKAQLEEAKQRLLQRPPRNPRNPNGNPNNANDRANPPRDRGPNNTGEWAWKAVAPKPGDPHEKKFRGKVYIYCPHHGDTKWVLKVNNRGVEHATGCRAKQAAEAAATTQTSLTATTTTSSDNDSISTDSSTDTAERTPSKMELQFAKALATAMNLDETSTITMKE